MKKINFKIILVIYLPLLLLINFDIKYFPTEFTIPSFLISYSIFFMLFSILKKVNITTMVLGIASFILLFISYMKESLSGVPLFLSDFFHIGDIGEIVNMVKRGFFESFFKILPLLLLNLAIIILLIFLSKKLDFEFKNKKKRIITFALSAITIIILFVPIKIKDEFILKRIYLLNNRKDYATLTSTNDYYNYFGHLSGMYGNMLESRVYEPDTYNKDNNKKELNKQQKFKEENKEFKKPNIIVVFSESFWDIDKIDDIKFNKKITKNFNELKKEGLYFDMISPSYGGISANVEYEFLTGGTLNYYSNSFIPYMNLYNNSKYYDTPSIIKELRNNGYYTKITAYSNAELFNCGEFYKYIGVDSTKFIPDVDKKYKKGEYVSDQYVTDKIIEDLSNKKTDKNIFYMTLTMQAHMPYDIDKYNKYDINITSSKLDKELSNKLKSYAQGVYDADIQLKRLYDYIKEYKEPAILVFYGDHLPYISGMDKISFFNTKDEKENIFRKYNTESLILANFDISSLKNENNNNLKYLGPDLLGSYILNHMDIEISDYYKWLYNTRNIIAASNRFISIDQNGTLYYSNNLSGNMKKISDIRKSLQYELFVR